MSPARATPVVDHDHATGCIRALLFEGQKKPASVEVEFEGQKKPASVGVELTALC